MNDYVWAGVLNLGVLFLAAIGAILILRRLYGYDKAAIDAKLEGDEEREVIEDQEEGECG